MILAIAMKPEIDSLPVASLFKGKVVVWDLSFDLKAKAYQTFKFSSVEDSNTVLCIDVDAQFAPIAIELVNYAGLAMIDGKALAHDKKIDITKGWYRKAAQLVAEARIEQRKMQNAIVRDFKTDYYGNMAKTYENLSKDILTHGNLCAA